MGAAVKQLIIYFINLTSLVVFHYNYIDCMLLQQTSSKRSTDEFAEFKKKVGKE